MPKPDDLKSWIAAAGQILKAFHTSAVQCECVLLLQTAGFLEAVAAAALQTRLQRHSLVRARIDCDGFTLLRGRVRSVSIAGRDWISPLGLSAVILEVLASVLLGLLEGSFCSLARHQGLLAQQSSVVLVITKFSLDIGRLFSMSEDQLQNTYLFVRTHFVLLNHV